MTKHDNDAANAKHWLRRILIWRANLRFHEYLFIKNNLHEKPLGSEELNLLKIHEHHFNKNKYEVN